MLLSNLARNHRLSLLRTGGAALGAKFSHLHWLGHTMFKRFFSTTPGLRAALTPAKVDGRKNLKTVGWKMYAYFHRHNTVCLLVEVVEDLDFMKKNQHLSYNEKVLYYMQLWSAWFPQGAATRIRSRVPGGAEVVPDHRGREVDWAQGQDRIDRQGFRQGA